jgi:hypothetical protein
MRRLIVPITFFLLVSAFCIAVWWLTVATEFEPAITSLSLLAAIMGLFIDRWLAERENRRRLLRSLKHETFMNLRVLEILTKTTPDQVTTTPLALPRFYNSTLSAVIASGAFSTDADSQLWNRLHSWLQGSIEANNRIAMAEVYTLLNNEAAPLFREKLSSSNVMVKTRETLLDFSMHLVNKYGAESGIDKDTVLFAVAASQNDDERFSRREV